MSIRLLPPEIADKIAAGEVIERPASVVKELVENSIDAGAADIRVEIREGGRRQIRVADNGCGIPAADVKLAFARHATSKLAKVSDLETIGTLGFRGEALASIAAVSQASILTRPSGQTVGRFVRVDNGHLVQDEARGCNSGTVFTVEHLFQSMPVRLKFLRQPQTEAAHIQRVVAHYALAHPHIRLGLSIEGRQVFQSSGNNHLYDVLVAAMGLETAEQMWAIADADALPHSDDPPEGDLSPLATSTMTVSGYVGRPALHRATRDYVSLFANGRWIQDRALLHAVGEAYHTLLPVGRNPVAVVLIRIDAGEVDVNVHPTKREVKFRDARRVYGAVQKAIRSTLLENAPVSLLAPSSRTWPVLAWDRPSMHRAFGVTSSQAPQPAMAGKEVPTLEPAGPVRLPLLRVVGQVGQTYIVAEGPQGMYLIDQHAAHERVLYERMRGEQSQTQPATQATPSQTLLEALTLELEPRLASVLDENLQRFASMGFDVTPFGDNTFLVRAVPSILATPDVGSAIVDILEMLGHDSDLVKLQAEERLIAAVCKRAAIKSGQTLSSDEMQHLVRQLEQCEAPRTCPHGRPTIRHFSIDELDSQFGRG